MSLQVVGAGLGRTGTLSLKLALEQLLDGPCYHMFEVMQHPDHIDVWNAAFRDQPVDWVALMADYRASVDWPAAACWRHLFDANPDALVLLSVRADADAWFASAQKTIFAVMDLEASPAVAAQRDMATSMLELTFTPDWNDPDAAKQAYEQHNAAVRAEVPAGRLLEWSPGDGWEPICRALDVPVPDEPFPHANSADEFRMMTGLDAPPAE